MKSFDKLLIVKVEFGAIRTRIGLLANALQRLAPQSKLQRFQPESCAVLAPFDEVQLGSCVRIFNFREISHICGICSFRAKLAVPYQAL